jgi:hypothetical protein
MTSEKRYYVIERLPSWKCWQICIMPVAEGLPYFDACFKDKKQAERYYGLVSSARASEFQIVEVEIKPKL